MVLPTRYDDDILGVENRAYPEPDTRQISVYSLVFPPIGFFPFADNGSGDYHGFYWPLGREELNPMVSFSSHDAYALIPEYGDLTSAARCLLACSEDGKLTLKFAKAFTVSGELLTENQFENPVDVNDHRTLLSLDPESPFRNCAFADQELERGNLDSAEEHYRKSIQLLPEYTAAHFGLGYLLRRLRRQGDASIHFRMSLICPLAFWGGCFWADHILPGNFRNDWVRKALLWLQQTRETHAALRDDPFAKSVDKLTLQTGLAHNPDFERVMQIVDELTTTGKFLDAVYLWIAIGDRAAMETTPFRERYGFSARRYGERLLELFRLAGLVRRAALLENMLAIMEQPDGFHL